MKVAALAFATAMVAIAIAPRAARADTNTDGTSTNGFRAVIDRVDLEPGALTGSRLRIYLSALSIDGHLLTDLGEAKNLSLYLNGSESKSTPYALGTYGATTAETAIVIAIENTQAYADALPILLEALDTGLLGELKDGTTQVAVMGYGDTTGSGKLGTLRTAHTKLAGIANDGSVGDPALVDTVERALTLLKRAKSLQPPDPNADENAPTYDKPIRKIILVIGDGKDRNGDRDRVTRIGKRAAKDGIRIHTLGFAPTDTRKPLLTLGELSKQSLGTFRWVRNNKADSWKPIVQEVADEITKQNVVTFFFTADEDPSGKKVKIVTSGRTTASSNEAKIPQLACGGVACDGYCAEDKCTIPMAPKRRGVLGWVFLLGGLGLGIVAVLGGIGYAMSKKAPAIELPPGVAPPAGVAGAPPAKKPKVKKGSPAAMLAAMQAAQAHATPANGPKLVILNGPRANEVLALRDGFTIGKLADKNLVIDDGFASSNHAVIAMDATMRCRLIDQGSTNGTMVNGTKITDMPLEPGCIIQIGSTQLRFLAQ